MPQLSTHFIVRAPAHAVWDLIGPRFAEIGAWATAIPASAAVSPSGRVCQTGVRLVPQVTETLVAYDETRRTLTYEATGMPAFVTIARNTWTVTPLDRHRSRVSLQARFDTRGLLGLLGRRAILAQVRRAGRHLADDLRHYVETGTPSPRKQRQLRRLNGRPRRPSPRHSGAATPATAGTRPGSSR